MTGKRIQDHTSMALAETKEQDGFLPIANVSRIMKKSLPPNAKICKEAKQTVQECISEFINFVTGEASDKCQREKRKTINGDDLLWAMTTLGFENYVGLLKVYLNKYRASAEEEKNTVAAQEDASTSPTSGHGREKIEDINSIVFAASSDHDHGLWEVKTFGSNYVGSLPDDSKRRSRLRIDFSGERMICNADDLENDKSYAFDENSTRVCQMWGSMG